MPARARGVEVHVVHADAVADDRAGFGHRGDDVRIDARELRDDRIRVRDQRDEFRFGFALAATRPHVRAV